MAMVDGWLDVTTNHKMFARRAHHAYAATLANRMAANTLAPHHLRALIVLACGYPLGLPNIFSSSVVGCWSVCVCLLSILAKEIECSRVEPVLPSEHVVHKATVTQRPVVERSPLDSGLASVLNVSMRAPNASQS